MKTILILSAFLLIAGIKLNAQQIAEVNGLYYTNNEPVSGKVITYFNNDQINLEMEVSEGMKDGETKIYFENGGLNELRAYKNNKMHGLWITYNNVGIKTAEANFKDGKKHGIWKVYNNEGLLVYEMVYQLGEKVGTWNKYSNGVLFETKKYSNESKELNNNKSEDASTLFVYAE